MPNVSAVERRPTSREYLPAFLGRMRAISLERHGKPEVLRLTHLPIPFPRPGEVRVRIRTIGINFPEVLSRLGIYGWVPKMPYIPGMEAFGEIDQHGDGVLDRKVGEPVVVGAQYGAYAEYICVPENQALTPPHGLTAEQSAAFLVNYLTAWIGLMEMARLRPSDTVLVTSAAGGVGSAVVQIAHHFGAKVIGLAGSSKQEVVRSLGADEVFDYQQEGWPARLKKALGARRADVIFELVGGEIYRECLEVVAPTGRVVVAGISGVRINRRNPLSVLLGLRKLPNANIREMLMHSYGVMSFHIGRLFIEQGLKARIWQQLVRFVEEHGIKPHIFRTYGFPEIAEAHRALEARQTSGKIVVSTQ